MDFRRYEALLLFALQTDHLYYFRHLIVGAHDVELGVRVLKHFLARTQWKAGHALEENLEVLLSILKLLFVIA